MKMKADKVKDVLMNAICEQMNIEKEGKEISRFITENGTISELGFNSVEFVMLVIKIEMLLDIEFDDDKLSYNDFASFDELFKYIAYKVND